MERETKRTFNYLFRFFLVLKQIKISQKKTQIKHDFYFVSLWQVWKGIFVSMEIVKRVNALTDKRLDVVHKKSCNRMQRGS